MPSLAWIHLHRLIISLVLLVFCASISFAQDDEKQDGAKTEDEQSQQDEAEEDEEEEKEDGTAELDEAFSLKLTAQTTRDLDKVVDLLEEALDKGLDEDGVESANQLLSSTLYEHADLISKQIFKSAGRDRRWRRYRQQALTRLERAVELNEKMGQAYQLMARLHGLPAGDREEGRNAIEKAIEMAGDDQKQLSESLVIRAILSDDEDSMLADLSQAIKIDPANVDAVRQRGGYYLKKNEPDKAVEDFKTWLASDKDNIEAYHQIARSLSGLKKFDEAIEILEEAIKVDDENTESFILKAQLNMLKENWDGAAESATAALKLKRKLYVARLIRAEALFNQEKFDEALEDVGQVIEEQPQLPDGHNLRFEIHFSQSNFGAAAKDIKALTEIFPDRLGLKLQLAQLYNADDQPRRAVRMYNKVLGSLPDDSRADEVRQMVLRGRGDARLSLGQHKEAIEDYDKALEFAPENDGILNNLAWVLATSPEDDLRDGERAVKLAEKACKVTDYKRPHILSTLASGYAETGDFEKAIEWIEKAVEVNEEARKADKDGDQAQYDDQLKSLKDELAFYKEEKPWREIQNVEEEKRKKELEGKAKKADEAEDSKDDDSAKDEKDSESDDDDDKSESEDDDDKKSDDDDSDDDGKVSL